jgi:phosphatidylglycerophosphate synthase
MQSAVVPPAQPSASPVASHAPALTIVRATAEEVEGAGLRVAGLTVFERALRQLLRMRHRVVVAVAPGFPLPPAARLPAAVEIHAVVSAAAIEDLRASLGAAAVVNADVVRPHNRNLEGGVRVTDAASRRQAEDAIFAELLRGDLGLVARYLNKPVSFRITRYLLCRLPITPNHVTIGAGVVGLAGAALCALGLPWAFLTGLVLAHVQSVLDGCDGELARVRFQQSAIGEWLDTIVDDALNLALTAGIGVGLWRLRGDPIFLLGGLLGCAMLLTYNVVAYRELVRQGEGGEVLKVRWWFAGGGDLKATYATGKGQGLKGALFMLGRRDFFIAAWVVYALVGLAPLILIHALTVAAVNFTVAVGQIVWRVRRP